LDEVERSLTNNVLRESTRVLKGKSIGQQRRKKSSRYSAAAQCGRSLKKSRPKGGNIKQGRDEGQGGAVKTHTEFMRRAKNLRA